MKVTWLGQAGLLFEKGERSVLIDPYFSDSVASFDPAKKRRIKLDEKFLKTEPSVMIFTHDHADHYDEETAPVFFARKTKRMTVLSPFSVWQKARKYGFHNYVLFDRQTEWTEYGFRFRAVKAVHSDAFAIGVVITDLEENKTYYVTGDTLYSEEIFGDISVRPDAVFVCINGEGNNMNATDATRFCDRLDAAVAVPIHFGMFDDTDPRSFLYKKAKILKIYQTEEI